MSLFSTFLVALRALQRNKLRSSLTTLGIVIGVSAVIAMVAIGEGAKAQVEATFNSMGSNVLMLMSGSTSRGGAHGGFGSLPTLTWDDLEAIQSQVSSVAAAAPMLQSNAQLSSDELNWSTTVVGTSADYFIARNWGLARGTLFGASDIEGSTKVVVVGQTVADNLFGSSVDPLGLTIRIKNIPFEVVGLLTKKGQSPMGQDFDDTVFIPYTTFQSKVRGGLQKYIAGAVLVSAVSPEATTQAQRQITDLLRDRHHLAEKADDDFHIRNMAEVANAAQEGTSTLTALLASIAAVSLLVGGIGIMNIMLVSVTERTREIGIRMAVGAKPRDIMLQFLVESLTLSLVGGLIGAAAGAIAAQRLSIAFSWPFLVRPAIIVVAVGFSALVGVVFGLYPARQASRLDPIEALRYE